MAAACSASGVGSLSVTGVPQTAEAGTSLDLALRLQGADPGTVVRIEVVAGGGSVSPALMTFDEGGSQPFTWTLGVAPVPQRIRVFVQGPPDSNGAPNGNARDDDGEVEAEGFYAVDATRTTTLQAKMFGDVHAMLETAKRDGSTEDLAFAPSGEMLVMGVPGGLIKVSKQGKSSPLPTTGDAIVHPLGLAYDAEGRLWICDSKAHAIKRMDAAGKVTTLVTEDDGVELGSPNHLAVLTNGDVVFSDPCMGKIVWIDGKTGNTKARHAFDLTKEGGPNGVALSPDGESLFVTTANTASLCGHTDKLKVGDNVAGLYKVALAADAFNGHTAVVEGMALFGDGLAFDAEGNLYVCLVRVKDLQLQYSAIEVLPKDGDTLRPFLSAKDSLYANVLFGPTTFGDTYLYVALLSVQPFTEPSQRGLARMKVGIAGAPLGHQAAPGS